MAEEVKVLGTWFSPYSKRVEMALKMKGVEYEYIEEDLRNKSPLLLQSNPLHQKIPVLIHNGKPISESLIIVEYIDETWKDSSKILPIDPHQRASARFWAKFIDDKVSTMWRACWKGEEQEKLKEEAIQAFKLLENEIKDKKLFGGDNVGFVDVAANFIAYWIPIASELGGVELMSESKFPNLCRWANDFCTDSLAKQFLPTKDAMIERYKPK